MSVISPVALVAACCTGALGQQLDTLRSEPVYKTAPRYIKVIFGHQAKSTSWLVLDGDVAYIDRQCRSELTEQSSRVLAQSNEIPAAEPSTEDLEALKKSLIDIGADPKGARQLYQWNRALALQHHYFKLGFVNAGDGRHELEMHSLPDGITINKLDGLVQSTGKIAASSQPATAPIVHFNGPLELSVFAPDWVHHKPGGKLNRQGANSFGVLIGTPGHGEGTFACLYCKDVPKEVSPTAAFTFAFCGNDGTSTAFRTIKLSQRC